MDAWRAHGSVVEEERRPDGRIERALTIFLAGAECPFTCTFCDLWRYTIDGPTPRGAIPRQIADMVAGLPDPRPERIKLYNASNFFDRRAVPPEDLPGIARLCEGFSGVTVESHVNTIGSAVLDFSSRVSGRLEIAMGLETVHAGAVQRLNKHLDLERFDKAVAFLRESDVDVRVFVLLGAPYVPADESVEWTVRTVRHAVDAGANVVAIIPVRGGNGELDRLRQTGEFTPPTFEQLERALDASLGRWDAIVTADLWDVAQLPGCDVCGAARLARLARMNVTQRREPAIQCNRHVIV